ncbi:ATP-dependent acyl-CoA ligase [Nocardia speluncae]|uniref:ATP-dependent acyl-CoA ligase n=1 Tax=Nocardia speluncae TaxID=419477 RepID=A0A846XBR6_9NOCA|nr:AMP-binding protein [Nocardia speluncae]NKY31474.1 ATP-dependent acyl-CoA ligase [Nocardia speluncae]
MTSRLRPADECVLPTVLRRRAAERPDQTFVIFEDGVDWTYARMLREAEQVAAGLVTLGVGRGDRVVSWLPNGPDALRVWFGVNLLGAILVPLNTAYRGGLLEHAFRLSGAEVAVVHSDLLPRLGEIDLHGLRDVVAVGPGYTGPFPVTVHSETIFAVERPGPPAVDLAPWDTYAIILTSGTTGPSKGVICTYAQLSACAEAAFEGNFGPGDRYLVTLPLFHAGGTIGVNAAVVLGGSIALTTAFRTSEFWDLVRATGSTHVTLLGVMATFLSKQPESAADTEHPLRRVFMIPLSEDAAEFARRFDVDLVAMFNMTEVSIPIISELNPSVVGTSGRVRPGVEARLVDEHDREVADGTVGELIVRADRPWTIANGYLGRPEATAAAWRNGWFHTGDAFRRVDGEFFFVDRLGDTIRRRGENISSFEVESEILAHPDVQEAAVVATPSPDGEDEVLAVVAPVAGRRIDVVELLEFVCPRMAHFMVPRFVRVLDELPKTPTSKIQKHLLRAEGVTADTLDREDLGVVVKRGRVGSRE